MAMSLITAMWCIFLILPAWLVHSSGQTTLISGIIRFFFLQVCHQLPERSFFLWGEPLAVCSRCAGFYFGFFIGCLLFPSFLNEKEGSLLSPRYLIFAAIPPLVEFISSHAGFWDSTNLIRGLTGFILGFTISAYVLVGLINVFIRQYDSKGSACKTCPAS